MRLIVEEAFRDHRVRQRSERGLGVGLGLVLCAVSSSTFWLVGPIYASVLEARAAGAHVAVAAVADPEGRVDAARCLRVRQALPEILSVGLADRHVPVDVAGHPEALTQLAMDPSAFGALTGTRWDHAGSPGVMLASGAWTELSAPLLLLTEGWSAPVAGRVDTIRIDSHVRSVIRPLGPSSVPDMCTFQFAREVGPVDTAAIDTIVGDPTVRTTTLAPGAGAGPNGERRQLVGMVSGAALVAALASAGLLLANLFTRRSEIVLRRLLGYSSSGLAVMEAVHTLALLRTALPVAALGQIAMAVWSPPVVPALLGMAPVQWLVGTSVGVVAVAIVTDLLARRARIHHLKE
ncbi:hypothetical protein [Euzebya pacifica]|uniref:hypothetical protein n=1 Tax=Euzebya pacifica TaxID=1608957 RepID=UPI000DF7341A|nr:hypothetical protein [Euzebya pacifica]